MTRLNDSRAAEESASALLDATLAKVRAKQQRERWRAAFFAAACFMAAMIGLWFAAGGRL